MDPKLFERNKIVKLSFDFSLLLIEYCEQLQSEKKYIVSNQLLRSGTAIGANIMEAQGAESRTDFIHKMKIAAKEGEETQYWLLLCAHSDSYPDCSNLMTQLHQINKLLGAIITTTKESLKQNNRRTS